MNWGRRLLPLKAYLLRTYFVPAIKLGAGNSDKQERWGCHPFSESSNFLSKPAVLNSPTSPGTSVSGSSHLLVQKVCAGHWRSSDKGRVLVAQGAEEASWKVWEMKDGWGVDAPGIWHTQEWVRLQGWRWYIQESPETNPVSLCQEIVEDKLWQGAEGLIVTDVEFSLCVWIDGRATNGRHFCGMMSVVLTP